MFNMFSMFNMTPVIQNVNPAYMAEFAAAFILLLFGNGVCANATLNKTKGNRGGYFMVVAGWAIAVALIVFLFARASGAHANPAITLTLALAGKFPWPDVAPYLIAQLSGALLGAVTVFLAYYRHFQEPGMADEKLGVFCTVPAVYSPFWNFMTEMIATAALLFIVTGLGYAARDGETPLFDPGFSPLAVGFVILAVGLGLGGPTGFAINPIRDLGPRIAHALLPIQDKRDSDWRYAWIPIVAPLFGGVLGYLCWRLLFGNAVIPAMISMTR